MVNGVLFAVPTLGKLHYLLVQQLLGYCKALDAAGVKNDVMLSRAFPHSANRNAIVDAFLKHPDQPEYLVMIDDDIVPQSSLLEMLTHDYDVVSADCTAVRSGVNNGMPTLTVGSASLVPAGPDTCRAMTDDERGQVMECTKVGTGCIAIHRRVLEAMKEKGITPFLFRFDDQQRVQTSEDYCFSERVLELGFKMWHYGKVRCAHFKEIPV